MQPTGLCLAESECGIEHVLVFAWDDQVQPDGIASGIVGLDERGPAEVDAVDLDGESLDVGAFLGVDPFVEEFRA